MTQITVNLLAINLRNHQTDDVSKYFQDNVRELNGPQYDMPRSPYSTTT